MRAIYVTETGGPDVLTLTEQPEPTPGPGDLLVKTEAIGINFIDTYFRMGQYKRPLPYIPGDEGSGVVEAVGSDVNEFSVGDRVGLNFGKVRWYPRDDGASDAERERRKVI